MTDTTKSGDVDQNKVKSDAESIAKGGNPEAGQTTGNVGTGTQSPNQPANKNLAPVTGSPNPAPGTITQGNPGAQKPGETAANPAAGTTKPESQAPAMSEEEAEDKAEAEQKRQLEGEYGPDFVTAEKVDQQGNVVATSEGVTQKQHFSKRSWDLLGPYKQDGTKDGWRPVVNEPAEVKALKNKKATKPQ